MALAIYKPGQGYWTRLLSALGAAVIVLAGVVWLWTEMDQLGSNLTVAREVSQVIEALNHPDIKSIERVAFIPASQGQGPMVQITDRGAVHTVMITPDAFALALRNAQDPVVLSPGDLSSVSYASGQNVSGGFQSFAFRNQLYFKSLMAVLVIGVFGGLIFWFSNKPNVVDFFIATEAEMKKVNWPTAKDLRGSTLVVIAGMFMLTAVIFIIDVGFLLFFTTIRILPPLAGGWKAIFGLGG